MFIKIILYAGCFLGLWIFVAPLVIPSIKNEFYNYRFRRTLRDIGKKRRKNWFINHIEMIINSVFGIKTTFAVVTFFQVSAALFVIVFILLNAKGMSLTSKFFFSIVAGVLPYLILRIMLINIRLSSSYEGITLVTELSNQYKICNLNMVTAIEQTAKFLKNSPYSKKALFRLSLALKEYRSESELDVIIRDFVYTMGTEWAAQLGINIFLSVLDGTDVRASLTDIIDELKQIKEVIEKDKRENNESFIMILFFTPVLYFLSLYGATKFFGFSLSKLFAYQILNPMGFQFFLMSIGSMILNVVILLLIRKPKYDF
jgi:hypothetical protein